MTDTEKIHGIIPAMVTPLERSGAVNQASLRRLSRYLMDAGVHGLFATGSQGEFWALTAEEKIQVWQTVVEEAQGRTPVYAGTGAVTTREAVELARAAETCGVDGISVLTPYFITPNENELYEHYRAVAAATRLPVLLYTNPARTGGLKISPQLAGRLAKIDNIVGIKDSSGDLEGAAEFIRLLPGFTVLMGRDTLIYGGLLYGAKGAIAATANVAPALVVSIYGHYRAGRLEESRRAQEELAALRMAFTWGTFPVVIKEALDLMGMEAGPARAPVGALSPEVRARLKQVLMEMKLVN
jgi:4-hydroxy-tetrahydrodipicolinate synthase